ncbi:MAG: 50S ribosomal protein L10 [Marinilabiliaceae bacterium]|nr:50S ribosomal protein L10 [Marinilabiliaceae bacterium]
MKKEDKNTLIGQLTEIVKEYAHFYVVDLSGLNAEQTSKLRRECFNKDIKLMVVKNTIFVKALKSINEEEYSALDAALKGSSAIMFTNTGNEPAKLIKQFNLTSDKPSLKGAYVEQSVYVGAQHLDELVAIKSKNELIADIIALLQSPAKNVISALQGAAGNKIHGVLETLSNK